MPAVSSSRQAALALAVLACALLGSPVDATAGDRPSWPQFRGPDRDGHADAGVAIEAWPATGPRIAWRRPVGAGYSGVAVDRGLALTMWQDEGEQLLVALESASGAERWRVTTGPRHRSPYGDGPRSTPSIAGDRVFAIDAGGRLVAVRLADGERLWSRDLASDLGARLPAIGYASSPLVEGGRLLLEVGSAEGAFVALDAATGKVAWRSGSDDAAYSSPIAFDAGGQRHVVFFSASGLHAVSPDDGRSLWRFPWASPCPASGIPLNAASPIFVPPDRVLASSAYGDRRGAGLLRIPHVGEDGGQGPVDLIWHELVIDSPINSPVLVDDHVYGFKGGILVCVEAASGEVRWTERGFGRGSLLHADGKLIVLGETGRLALVAASPAGYRELASSQLMAGRSWTAPALAGDELYVRDQAELIRVDLAAVGDDRTPR